MTYPRFFLVDFDIYVRLEQRGDKILGFNAYDSPYPIGKALSEGREITEAEYNEAVEVLRDKANLDN